ncbi:MAG: AMP-binding protein [Opitutales bacterium]|nr:AMP-binding protein [Opitutales bacterium]
MDPYWQLISPGIEAAGINADALRRNSTLGTAEPWQRVYVCDPDPLHYLNAVFAALQQGCSVWLGDPSWGTERVDEAFRWIRPQHVFGMASPTLYDAAPDASLLPLRRSLGGAPGIFIPTGGSSGGLKFAVHSWDTLAAAAKGFDQHFGAAGKNACCVLPVNHVSGFMQVVRALINGGSFRIEPWKDFLLQEPHFDPADYYLSLVPLQLKRLLEVPQKIAFLKRFRMLLIGGAPADEALLQQALEHDLPVVPSYGATETGAVIAALSTEALRNGRRGVGKPLPHIHISCETCAKVSASIDCPGTVHLLGPSLCRGYFPGGVFTDKEFCTNDLGCFDADGYLHIIGRIDRMILSGGKKIDPFEVEQAFLSTGLVRDIYVRGEPDETWGQVVVAYYVPVDQAESITMLLAELKGMLASWQLPKYCYPLTRIPRTGAGKVILSSLPH